MAFSRTTTLRDVKTLHLVALIFKFWLPIGLSSQITNNLIVNGDFEINNYVFLPHTNNNWCHGDTKTLGLPPWYELNDKPVELNKNKFIFYRHINTAAFHNRNNIYK